jgi:drug/metabolite transporter (DMT)-like permease
VERSVMTDSRFLLISRLVLASLFIGFYGFIVLRVLSREVAWPEGVKDVIVFLLGALTTSVITMVGFFFNSSQGSAAKDAMLLNAQPKDPQ